MNKLIILLLLGLVLVSGCNQNHTCRVECHKVLYGCTTLEQNKLINCVSSEPQNFILKDCLDRCVDTSWRNGK